MKLLSRKFGNDDFHLVQVPGLSGSSTSEQENAVVHTVVVVDYSGSMSVFHPVVKDTLNEYFDRVDGEKNPITFIQHSEKCNILRRRRLPDHFNEGGMGRGTDIYIAMEALRDFIVDTYKNAKMLGKPPPRFTVCYIADGCDNRNGSKLGERLESLAGFGDLSNISMTTFACGTLFPTTTAMTCRNVFHNPEDVSTPLVTIAATSAEFPESFSVVKSHLGGIAPSGLSLDPPLASSPWGDPYGRVWVGSWVWVPTDIHKLTLGDCDVFVDHVDNSWSLTDLISVVRQWVREMHSAALRGIDVRNMALQALSLAKAEFSRVTSIQESENKKNATAIVGATRMTFVERVKKKRMTSERLEFTTLLNELRQQFHADFAGLSEADLAQRLAIGTRVSKYHTRSLAWKGLTPEKFEEILGAFCELLVRGEATLRNAGDVDNHKSAVTLESNLDVLLEDGFLDAVRQSTSQYFLVENFPVVGLALRTAVSEGATINPWLVRVASIARVTPFLDSATLRELAVESNIAVISTGEGEAEEVSAVCPLVSEESGYILRPFLRSRLYQVLMTYLITQSADIIDRNAHLALLAATYVYLLVQPSSEWRTNLMDAVVTTTRILFVDKVRGKETWFSHYVEIITSEDYAKAFITESDEISTTCESISKPILALASSEVSSFDKPRREAIAQALVREYVGRVVVKTSDSTRDMSDWFHTEVLEVSCGTMKSFEDIQLAGELESYFWISPIYEEVDAAVDCAIADAENVVVNCGEVTALLHKVKKAKAASVGPVNWTALERFVREVLCAGEATVDSSDFLSACLFDALRCRKSYDRNTAPVSKWTQLEKRTVSEALIAKAKRNLRETMRKKLRNEALNAFKKMMIASHDATMVPMSMNEIVAARTNMGLTTTEEVKEQLVYDSEAGICRCACQTPSCRFYLIPNARFSNHLEYTGDGGNPPIVAMHRTIKHVVKNLEDKESEIDAKEIDEMVRCGKYMKEQDERKLADTVKYYEQEPLEDRLEIIETILEKYRRMKVDRA
eukprot:Plantae.Rhodophyta-Hildenbrandia_rubra.ctg13281.p1 GENE.Plantae.Rhodophyta-Hildenbrandia_rubra.ctg13281~~Plantae.Rhodophyta-Hildenbrandia_rubra.ctg13281.p1  ORF type:complete len:1025 (+),score=173.89 Plantae.Rhodophyta-Hildenbrandia_rubra.ctg13281:46-3120(+)